MAVYFQRFVFSEEERKGNKHEQEHRAGLDLLRESLEREYPLLFNGLNERDLERELAKQDKGKPFLKNYPQIHFNISHGKDMAVCGIDGSPLGVDVEAIRPVKPTVFRRVLTAKEQDYLEKSRECFGEYGWYRDFFRIWTLKESYAKAIGLGLAVDFTCFSFNLPVHEKQAEDECSEHSITSAPLLFPGRKEEEASFPLMREAESRFFVMREVKGCLHEETGMQNGERQQEKTQEEASWEQWRFFQTMIDQEYVISCCVRR